MSEANTTTTTPSAAAPPAEKLRYTPFAVMGALVVLGVAAALLLREAPKAATSPTAAISVSGEVVTIAPDAPQWQYLGLTSAELGPPLQPLPVPGRVEFDENRSASVGAPLQGRVEKVLVRFGDRVKKGQRLFSVRSAAYADLDRELASAREAVVVKQRVMERVTDLVKLQAAPDKERLAAEAEFKEAQLSLKAAQAKQGSLAVSGESDNLFWVTAPRDGTIVEHDMFASQEVGPDREKPLLRISDLDEVIVIGDVAERDAVDLKVGTEATIAVGGAGATRKGIVERVSEVVDPRRHTVEIRIRVRNDDRALRPNAFVEVTLGVDPAAQFIRAPAEAVVTEGERSVVFLQGPTGSLVRTAVTPGRARDGLVEIRSGLAPGQKYVAKGALLLLNQVDLAQ